MDDFDNAEVFGFVYGDDDDYEDEAEEREVRRLSSGRQWNEDFSLLEDNEVEV